MAVEIKALVASKIGFASHQNAVPVLRELEIRSVLEDTREDLTLSLKADPPFLSDKTWSIDRLACGATLHVTDRDVPLNAAFLDGLNEGVRGEVILTVEAAGETLATSRYSVELLARGEWGGMGAMAELLPAFVMPNDPAVDRVLKAASEVLHRAGKRSGIDGYQAGSRERAWELVSAIWSAVCGLRIAYAVPPASFEQQGQKVRTPSAILDGRVATCLDTALLFAATMEQAGLNPLVVVTKGHAFAGCWLQPVEFSSLITDEAAALRRRIDLQDLVVFETTLATQANPASFSQAVKAAQRLLAEDAPDPFDTAVDIRRARMQRIRPLSLAGAGSALNPEPDRVHFAEALEAAPALPAFDVEVTEEATTAADRVGLWQRKLLNLTTSNRLLHVPDGSKVVRLLCPEPAALEDRLALGSKVKIVALPELTAAGRDERIYEAQTNENLRDQYARTALLRGEVLSIAEKDKLEATLIDLYRKAKTDLEEGGANTLFLVLGFLKWKKSPTDTRTYRAPLVLLPVRLERKSALSGVTMLQHEDEPRFNLTLLELLRQDFELRIPTLEGPLPTDENGIDVGAVWTAVRRAVRDIPGFEVTQEVVLGTFSFAKYLMWKDLVDRSDRLKESPIVRHLMERKEAGFEREGEFPRPENLDSTVDPASLFAPLPADSSQLAAVVASAQGHDFVLDGPPGTGKSQTIANIIAHNMALGRRVLFVAEKRAALEVVQRRLAKIGLGEFCLELHSAKATKTEVLKQLDRAWTTRDTLSSEEWEREASAVRYLRGSLNDVVALLHKRDENGLTIHHAIGRVVRDWTGATPRLVFGPDVRHTEDDMRRFRDAARRLGLARAEVVGLADVLGMVEATTWSNGWQEALVSAARAVPGAVDALTAAGEALIKVTRLPLTAQTRESLGQLYGLVGAMLATAGQDLRFAFAPNAVEVIKGTRTALGLVEHYRREEAALSVTYQAEAVRRIDLPALRAAWTHAEGQMWLLAFFSKRKLRGQLAAQGGATGRVDVAADLPRLENLTRLLGDLDALMPLVAATPGWAGLASRAENVGAACGRAEALRGAILAAAETPEQLAELHKAVAALVVDANEMLGEAGGVARAYAALGHALQAFDAAIGAYADLAMASTQPQELANLRAQAVELVAHQARLKPWTDWRRVRDDAIALGLGPLVASVEGGATAPGDAVAVFETAYARWYASRRMDAEPLLAQFASSEHMDTISTYRALDARLSELAVRYIRSRICGLIPPKESTTRGDGFAVLRHQLQLQRRHKPIRQLATEMGEAFTRLAPCMLMSPLSIAQYLPPDQALFDLVIFDEASQIAPWDAIGAMARGTQVIVAGDPRQMPPTSFFTRSAAASDSETDTEEDMESILDECLAAGVRMHSLSWHYRSRHESLIAFSNHRYYEGGLVTFPAPVTRASAVEWRRIDGVYARGKDRTNTIEAKALVDEAVRRLTDPAFVAAGRTLGIITLNADQQKLVEDLLDKARRERPEIEPHFAEDRTEPVVVKNLETVQGDERDIILLGIGFGPTEPGAKTMSMSFGALNGQGGWRRLNVAVTRARQEMVLFTSFDPGMIDLNRTSARAVRDLKHFIEFAYRGPSALAEAVQGSVGGHESPFEQAVAIELTRRGWTVVPQIGVSRFRIDLGIVHPDRPGDYLLGVECDGATYHSAATARDRDKVRAMILEGLGWQLARVWSTDWWVDKAGAAERLHQKIEAALALSRSEATAGVAKSTYDEHHDIDVDEGEGDDLSLAAPEFAAEAKGLTESTQSMRLAKQIEISFASQPYRQADLSSFEHELSAARLRDDAYDDVLVRLISHVVKAEAPISEAQLVRRVARAHGIDRATRVIRDRIMSLAKARHHVERDGDSGMFIWPDAGSSRVWDTFRPPATAEDLRAIEEIALAEIRAAALRQKSKDAAVAVARTFGVKRLSHSARLRIEAALLKGMQGERR
jgi:very-short-patch-repair endonuclease